MRILVVDDDRVITTLARRVLEESGFAVDVVDTRESALTNAMVYDYDGIILDLGLPDGSGMLLIEELRKRGRSTPVLVLTGSSDPESTIRALDTGADDYQTKPIVPEQFKARVRALVRRGGAQRTEQLSVGNLLLNRLSRTIHISGAELRVTPRELAMLEHFVLHVDQVVTRSQLLEKVFDMSFDPGTNVVDVNVSRLRRKLEEAGATVAIESRRGIGFVLSVSPA